MAPVVVLVVVGLVAEAVAHAAVAEEKDAVHLLLWLGATCRLLRSRLQLRRRRQRRGSRCGVGGTWGGSGDPRARGTMGS